MVNYLKGNSPFIMELYFILAIFIAYFFLHIYLYSGLKLSSNYKLYTYTPPVTIIVAAKNEEQIIARCINTLKSIRYNGQLEIYLVNDKSSDKTKQIMYENTKDDQRFIVIDSRESETSNLKGKANAIDTAIEKCNGEIILSTDADCIVSPDWVSTIVSYYDEKTAMVNGFTNIKYERKLFDKIQALDWVYLLSLASSSSGKKKILSCVGNNISFRKNIYEKLGGYANIDFSVTEDLALMRAIDALPDFTIKYPVDSRSLVLTEPCDNLRTLYNQKKRWFRGGTGIRPLGYFLGFELYAVNLFLLTGFLYTPILFYLLMLLLKFISELLIMIPVMKKFRMKSLLKYYLCFQLYFSIYGLLLPLSFFTGKQISWKGRKF